MSQPRKLNEPTGRRGARRARYAAALALSFVATVGLAAADRPEGPDGPAGQVTYHGDVAPLLRQHCLGCHDAETAKGKLDLSSFETLMEGGREGPPVVAGKPDESLLLQLVSRTSKPFMPPKKRDPLTAAKVDVLRRWIAAGCPLGEAKPFAEPYARPLEPPIYERAPAITALVYSPSGERLYVAGFREILVHRIDRALAAARPGDGEPSAVAVTYPEARLLGESEQIHALALSPRGELLAAAGGNPARFGELQIWDTAGRRLLRFARLGQDTLFAVAFSAAGDRLVVAGADRAVHVLDASTASVLFSTEIHADWVFGVVFTADGSRIVSSGRDRSVKISAADDGEFIRNVANLDEPVMRLVARPGTDHFLVGGHAGRSVVYDAREAKELRKLERQPGEVLAAAFRADGNLLALAGAYDEVRVYDAEDGQRRYAFRVPERWTYALAFRPDGRRLAAAGFAGEVRIFDLEHGREEGRFVAVPIGRHREF